MSFFWLVVVFGWVIPIIIRRMGQDPRRRQLPPRDRGYNRYGGYPGNPYPRGFPGPQPPPPSQPSGSQPPESQPTGTPPGEGAWWQQPIPPGSFPGQTIPDASRTPDRTGSAPQRMPDQSMAGMPEQSMAGQTMPGQTMPGQTVPEVPPIPESSEPQGYRARKLAELDRKFTEQKISLEEYMKARNEVMRG
ncbi:hypothetical protein [Sinomonas susongensis]|uniref:hypothetical protein n=1 Tax=Sinomonas susongensis TaxID=1324851 RepID=UPI0011091F6D|nr:hypothetical protein [Sinomonas susongensis]